MERCNGVNFGKVRGEVGENRSFKIVKGVEYEWRTLSHGLGLFDDQLKGGIVEFFSAMPGRSRRRKRPSILGMHVTVQSISSFAAILSKSYKLIY
jgi:hypothetical protein